jgi:hypothetical protein
MRKVLSVLFTLLTITYCCHAQSFQLVDAQKETQGSIGEKIRAVIKIKNTTNQPIAVNVKVKSQQLGTAESSAFFWGDQRVDAAKGEQAHALIIPAGATEESFVSVLKAGLAENTSSITYCFYNVNKPNDSLTHEITYKVQEQLTDDFFFQDEDIKISNIYPNPVRDKAFFQYEILRPGEKVKLVIHNLLGSIVGEYELDIYQNKLTISTEKLNPGVYFYSLHVDKKNLMTKKFIIKR